jgi:steroid delta-isomerase-like uncharacterized protein
LLDQLLAPGYLAHDASGTDDAQTTKNALRAFRTAFPDFRFTIHEQLADGDKVVNRWTVRGTHRGDLFGIPPTGKAVEFSGISIFRIAGGQMQEAWVERDEIGMMRQLGLIPSPGQG